MAKITLTDLVAPKGSNENWQIGIVIGMDCFDLNIGPVLQIQDIISGEVVEELPKHVDKLVRAF